MRADAGSGFAHRRRSWRSAPPPPRVLSTSRATRLTSEAKERSCSPIVSMASFSCRISSRTSTVIFSDRSPLATAMVTSAMLRTCAVRLPAIWLTDSVNAFHTPETPLICARPPSLPSLPTTRHTRVLSATRRCATARMSLSVSAILPCGPVRSAGRRVPKSPFLNARSPARSPRSKRSRSPSDAASGAQGDRGRARRRCRAWPDRLHFDACLAFPSARFQASGGGRTRSRNTAELPGRQAVGTLLRIGCSRRRIAARPAGSAPIHRSRCTPFRFGAGGPPPAFAVALRGCRVGARDAWGDRR
jgi:hypothetical protein